LSASAREGVAIADTGSPAPGPTTRPRGIIAHALSTEAFADKARDLVPEVLRGAVDPLLDSIGEMTVRIRQYDAQIEHLCRKHPETKCLRQVTGVGPVTSLAFVLVIDDPHRFTRSREVGPYLGLVPRRDSSGTIDRQLRITKAGDHLMRRLLVGSAHYIIGPFGPDTDLAGFGRKMAGHGGMAGKKRAVVAVARRLGVLLHRLWVSGETYRPLHTPA
jgi:transposase